jgi:protein-S-isoprenylcysteine O-methyltransferase Ste14
MIPQLLTIVAWSAFVLSWIGAAFWADRAEKRPARREALLYRTVTVAGVVLLVAGGEQFSRAADRLWSFEPVVDYALVLVVLSGIAFTWWARLYLGRLWSSSVTKKADHRVVDTGPYAIVRHPIYTGIILACAATAAQLGTALAVAGVLVLWVGFWIKARLEERFLRGQLGEGAYDAYRQKVPMLVPFGPRGRERPAPTPTDKNTR